MGLTLGPVNQVTIEGLPVLFIKDLPPASAVIPQGAPGTPAAPAAGVPPVDRAGAVPASQRVTIRTDLFSAEVDTVGGVISLVALDRHRDVSRQRLGPVLARLDGDPLGVAVSRQVDRDDRTQSDEGLGQGLDDVARAGGVVLHHDHASLGICVATDAQLPAGHIQHLLPHPALDRCGGLQLRRSG